MSAAPEGAWFPLYRPEGGAAPVTRPCAPELFCLPHAGAGASVYWEWLPLLAPEVDVVPIQLPGRESRYKEPPRRSASDITAELIEPLADRAGPDFSLFGHSMGGLLAYEVTRAMTAKGRPPRHLFVSGVRAPQLGPPRRIAHLLPDPELLEVMEELAGTSPEVLAHPELVRLLLPVLRADFAVCETYLHSHDTPLRVPITVLGGLSDPSVSVSEMRAWRDLTSAGFEAEFYSGGHFYLNTLREEVIGALLARLGPPGNLTERS
ncbi:MAG TPA: alpha/beta fold hydrolase [Streptosporangiaceae bacterium]|nr:alpha/beta fold hydrolase [Streptosporangiaceae bacterium]